MKLEKGVDEFTMLELLVKAAAFKGLELYGSSSEAYTKPIKEYKLDDKLLALLAERRIKRHDRPDDVFTLSDENPQEKVQGWEPSNYWNFKLLEGEKRRFDLSVSIAAGLIINQSERGVKLNPLASGGIFHLLTGFRISGCSRRWLRMIRKRRRWRKKSPRAKKDSSSFPGPILGWAASAVFQLSSMSSRAAIKKSGV